MKVKKFICMGTAFALCFAASAFAGDSSAKGKKGLDVMVVYYPHWHVYPLGECWKGVGWTEWDYVKTAVPCYPGHNQPIVPTPGYLDSSNPKDVAQEIELAANHGVDVFLYDWYWYNGVKNMEEGLEQGFLKAVNKDKLKFAIMWANHDRIDFFRPAIGEKHNTWLYIRNDEKKFLKMIDYCIKNYFRQPNYYKPNGKIFFSIYLPVEFVQGLGGPEKVKELFAKADEKMEQAGLPHIYWNAMTKFPKYGELLKEAGFECTSSYNIQFYSLKDCKARVEKGQWLFDYSEIMDRHRDIWNDLSKGSPLPNIPIVTRGWDSTPRCLLSEKFPYKKLDYPYSPIIVNDTPDKFETLLREARDHAAEDPKKPFAILINAWNEYTEGCYLLPDRRNQMTYLQAMANVFGRTPKDKMEVVCPYSKGVAEFPAPTFEDVSYGPHYKQRMHVWLAESSKPTPVVIYIHGGGWSDGARVDERLKQILPEMGRHGISVVSVEYRWIQDANQDGVKPPVKAPLEDAARAVQFVRSKAKEWNIDPSRIALMGGSAGACSSLWVSLSPDMANPNSADPVARESTHVKIVSVVVAQTSLDPAQMREWTPNMEYGAHAFGYKNFDEWLADRERIKDLIAEYSPYAQVAKGNPTKFLLVYGDKPALGKPAKDPTHGANFGLMFKKRCDEMGVDCQTVYGKSAVSEQLDYIIKNLH